MDILPKGLRSQTSPYLGIPHRSGPRFVVQWRPEILNLIVLIMTPTLDQLMNPSNMYTNTKRLIGTPVRSPHVPLASLATGAFLLL